MNSTRPRTAGFTLMELLVAAAISFTLGIGGFAFFRAQLRSLIDQSAGLDAIEGARAALDFMANDIRMTGEIPIGGCPTCGLTNARSNTLTVSWDANANGTLDAGESITYGYDSSSKAITRTVNGTTQTLIKNVPAGGFSLQYFDTVGAPSAMSGSPSTVTTPANVRLVVVSVQVQTARATTVTTVNLSSNVALRNHPKVLARL